jgi:NitT/TauT family transport system permease protein
MMNAGWLQRFLYGGTSVLAVWGLWELLGRTDLMVAKVFPPPSQFISAISSGFKLGLASQTSDIQTAISSSVWRVTAGLSLGFLAAILVGCGIAVSGKFRWCIMPLLSLLAPVAPVAWIPLALVVFGIGNGAAVFIVFMGVFFTLTIGCVEAIGQVPARRLEVAALSGATPWQTWWFVVVPSILPSVFSNLRVNFVAAWMAVLAGEMTGLRDGLGAVIMNGRNLFDNRLILLGMFLIGITGFGCDLVLRIVQKRVLWWPANRD